MTLKQFEVLADTQKTKTIYLWGAYIGERKEEFYNVLIYQLDEFFVELFYNNGSSEIAHLNSFEKSVEDNSLLSTFISLN